MLNVDQFSLLKNLDSDLKENLETVIEWFRISSGTVVIHQGTPPDSAVFVLEGAFEISQETNGKSKLVSIAKAGSVLGEVGLLLKSPRNATCRATQDSHIGVLSKEDLVKMAENNPKLYMALIHLLGATAAKRLLDASEKVNVLISKNEIALKAAMDILESSISA